MQIYLFATRRHSFLLLAFAMIPCITFRANVSVLCCLDSSCRLLHVFRNGDLEILTESLHQNCQLILFVFVAFLPVRLSARIVPQWTDYSRTGFARWQKDVQCGLAILRSRMRIQRYVATLQLPDDSKETAQTIPALSWRSTKLVCSSCNLTLG